MALNMVVWELFVEAGLQLPRYRSLGYFHTKKEAKKRARKETRPTLIEKKII